MIGSKFSIHLQPDRKLSTGSWGQAWVLPQPVVHPESFCKKQGNLVCYTARFSGTLQITTMKSLVTILFLTTVFWGHATDTSTLPVKKSLAMIETGATSSRKGKWDYTRGGSGEISRFQIMPDVWKRYTKSMNWTNPEIAWTVARRILDDRVNQFKKKVGRNPDEVELYLLWNKPGHFAANKYKFYLVKRTYLQRAKRFANLVRNGL